MSLVLRILCPRAPRSVVGVVGRLGPGSQGVGSRHRSQQAKWASSNWWVMSDPGEDDLFVGKLLL